MTAPEPVAGQHRAEAWRVGNVHGERFGWSCLDCTSGDDGVVDAIAAERGAEWHALHPHGLATPGPVTGATQDPRAEPLARALHPGEWWDSPGMCYAIDKAAYRVEAQLVLVVVDAADAAAGIRRVRLDEAIERAAKASYEQYPWQVWSEAGEVQRRAHREQHRTIVTAALGGAS